MTYYVQQASNWLGSAASSISTSAAITPNAGDSLIVGLYATAATNLASLALTDTASNNYQVSLGSFAANGTAVAITFGSAPSGTSTALSGNFAGTTANYLILFSDGEMRVVVLTNGSTACSWSATAGLISGALTGSPGTSATAYSGQFLLGFHATSVPAVSTTVTATLGASQLQGILLGDYQVTGFLGANGAYQQNPGIGANTISTGAVPNITATALLAGLSWDVQGNPIASAGTGFTGRGAIWSGAALLEDETVTSSVPATFGSNSTSQYDNIFSIAWAFNVSYPLLADGYNTSGVSVTTGTNGTTMSAVTVGQLLHVLVMVQTASVNTITVTDTLGNTYTANGTGNYTTSTRLYSTFYCSVTNAGTSQVTAHYGGSASTMAIAVANVTAATTAIISPTTPYSAGNFENNKQVIGASPAANSQTSTNMPSLVVVPAIVGGFGYNDGNNGAPTAGTSPVTFTQVGTCWAALGSSACLTYEVAQVNTATAYAATFTPIASENAYSFVNAFNIGQPAVIAPPGPMPKQIYIMP
jgi:hypothetical protein